MCYLLRSKRSENTGPDRRILGDPEGHYQRDYFLIMHPLLEGNTGLKVTRKSKWPHRILPECGLGRYVEIGRPGGDDHLWILNMAEASRRHGVKSVLCLQMEQQQKVVLEGLRDGTAQNVPGWFINILLASHQSSCPCGLGSQLHGTTHANPWQNAQNSAPVAVIAVLWKPWMVRFSPTIWFSLLIRYWHSKP